MAYALASQSFLLQSNSLGIGLSLLFQVNRGNHGLELLLSSSPQSSQKRGGGGGGGGGGVQVGLDILETNMSPQRTRTSHLSIIRVLSNPQKAALLPLGSYSSYRLVGKMY